MPSRMPSRVPTDPVALLQDTNCNTAYFAIVRKVIKVNDITRTNINRVSNYNLKTNNNVFDELLHYLYIKENVWKNHHLLRHIQQRKEAV